MPSIGPIVTEHDRMQLFSRAELKDALKFFKTKMSSGPNGIPMRLIKFYAQKQPGAVLTVFNEILRTGFPDVWKIARRRWTLKNYRPVSNLSSLSK